jgi:long-chain acyl-CoA synthetase
LAEISNTGKKEGLNGFEIAKNIFLEPQGFIFKGILTNTMKLIRYEARKVYKSEIEQLYLEGEISLK